MSNLQWHNMGCHVVCSLVVHAYILFYTSDKVYCTGQTPSGSHPPPGAFKAFA